MGGDVIAGTNFVDALKVFEKDEDTEAIIIVGELGGTSEEEAADWIIDYRKRVKNPKPIAAVIGGFQASPGRVMGHAGAWTGLGEGTSESKYRALENAGVTMVDHPAKFGGVMKNILTKSGHKFNATVSSGEFTDTHILTWSRKELVPVLLNRVHIIPRTHQPETLYPHLLPRYRRGDALSTCRQINRSICSTYTILILPKHHEIHSRNIMLVSPHLAHTVVHPFSLRLRQMLSNFNTV
jgi:hypothetical protein